MAGSGAPATPDSGSGAGAAQQVGDQLFGLWIRIHVQLGQSVGQQQVGAPHPIRAAKGGLQAHDPPVQLLSRRIGDNRLLQRRQRPFQVADGLAELGQAGQGIDRPPPQVLSRSLHPAVRCAVQQGAAIGLAGVGASPTATAVSSSARLAVATAAWNCHRSTMNSCWSTR